MQIAPDKFSCARRRGEVVAELRQAPDNDAHGNLGKLNL